MKILVMGSDGQIARSLSDEAASRRLDLVRLGRPDVDLGEPGSAAAAIEKAAADVVINAAAFTAVDAAEAERDLAFRINADAAGEIAAPANRARSRLLHLSTDYVFDGQAGASYDETGPTNPINVYGQSKLEGEVQVRGAARDSIIVRTAWIYSPYGRNFVKTIVAAAAQRDTLRVVADQHGSPTCARDLAAALIDMTGAGDGWGETYHLAGGPAASWHALASEVMAACRDHGLAVATIEPIATSAWPTPAARPQYSVLNSERAKCTFGVMLPDWRVSVRAVVGELARAQG